jgi:hypothetical protein
VADQAEQRQVRPFDGAQLELLRGEPAAFPQQSLAVEVQPRIGQGALVAPVGGEPSLRYSALMAV